MAGDTLHMLRRDWALMLRPARRLAVELVLWCLGVAPRPVVLAMEEWRERDPLRTSSSLTAVFAS